ncbi:type IV toxin-antitoxin system AbiEi family antitoxin domain-containing protein [Crossiella cryophila]
MPSPFTYTDARNQGMSDRRLYALRDSGAIESIGRGLFRWADDELTDPDLLEINSRAPEATLCLTAALARHGLTDQIPATIDIALPRGRRRPQVRAPVSWHLFAPGTFQIGRERLALDETNGIGIYNAERCILDAFRLRRWEGPELGNEALRRWLRRPGTQPSSLLRMAREFPRTETALRHALEVLL